LGAAENVITRSARYNMNKPLQCFLSFVLAAIFSSHATASTPEPAAPLNQNLMALDYAKDGQQTGCGLRITGEVSGDLWVNVLLSVFAGETQPPVGMFKVVVRKVEIKDGQPQLQNGKLAYSSIGNIQKAWLKTDSGASLQPTTGTAAAHGDGYMTSLAFANAVDLLVAIPQAGFKVGVNLDAAQPDLVFGFDRRITSAEADKLSACMQRLRAAMDAKNNGESL
jgi:hypothetical protein